MQRVEQEEVDEFAARLVRGVSSERARIDTLLQEHLSGWRVDRLGVLERAILRVAVYELLTEEDTPVPVAVDEAVGLAKRFCSAEAGALVNGILGNIAEVARQPTTSGGDSNEGAH